MKRLLLSFICLILALFPLGSIANAQDEPGFYAGMIIRDTELFSPNTMSVDDIQAFLDSHSGILKHHVDVDVDGLVKSAAMIIHDAAIRNNMNAQYLLVLLQKEQGLITDADPYQSQINWATGYAVCDTCSTSHPSVLAYKGFAKQVDQAAWRTRYFYENIEEFHFQEGQTYNIDGQTVYLENRATAALYNYTPHLRGNQIFWKLWKSWFDVFIYPDGSLLQAYGQPGVWLIENGKRHAFTSKASLTTRYDLNLIIQVPGSKINGYDVGPSISYPEFAILKIPSGKIFLLVDSELRWIIDEFTFRQLGYTLDEVDEVTEDEIAYFSEGPQIDSTSLNPVGALLQDPDSFGIYYVKNGIKHPLLAPELLSLNFPHLRNRPSSRDELDRYKKGAPVKLKSGLLVKSANDPRVFIVAGGEKFAIDSEFTFNSLGYDWNDIQIVSSSLLDLHHEGETIAVQPELTDEEAGLLIELTSK